MNVFQDTTILWQQHEHITTPRRTWREAGKRLTDTSSRPPQSKGRYQVSTLLPTLRALHNHYSATGQYPRQSHIVKVRGVTSATISAHCAELESYGLVVRVGRYNGQYMITEAGLEVLR